MKIIGIMSEIALCGVLLVVTTATRHALNRRVSGIAENISESVEDVRLRVSKRRSD